MTSARYPRHHGQKGCRGSAAVGGAISEAQVLGLGAGGRRAGGERDRATRGRLHRTPGDRRRTRAGSAPGGGAGPAPRRGWRRRRRSEPAFSTDPYDRAAHTYGRSFRDLVRAFRRDYAHAPDLVAFPRGEDELVSVLDWCSEAGVAAIPFGGGSSVVGGVEPDVGDGYRGAISVDLRPPAGRAGGRPYLACRADRGGHAGPGAGGAAEAARPDLAAFPAVVRVVDAGRVDSDALGRPLRDAAHPYRRVRGVGPRGDAARRAPDQAAAGLRCGPVGGAAVLRLRGHAGRDHRGVDARAAAAAVPGRRLGALRRLRRRGGGVPGARAVRASSGQLPPARPRRGADVGKR